MFAAICSALILVVSCAYFCSLMREAYKIMKNGEWHPNSPTEMRRYVNGAWETRPSTEEEISEYVSSEAW